MPSRKPITTSNRILSRLSLADFALLEPRLTAVELPLRKQLEMPRKPITYVYFIESGYASVVANGDNKHSIEVGLIGREGMTGLAVLMGTDRTYHETFMQCAGRGWQISAQNLRDAMEKSSALRNRLLQYGQPTRPALIVPPHLENVVQLVPARQARGDDPGPAAA